MSELFRILGEGSIILTRHGNQNKWINNSIVGIEPETDTILITLKQEYLDSLLEKGQSIEIRFTEDSNVHQAKGVVDEIMNSSLQRVKIKIESLKKIQEKREEFRYDVHFNSILKGIDVNSAKNSVVINISKKGLGIISSQNLAVGIDVFIDIFLDSENMLKLKGSPMRKKMRGSEIEYGMSQVPVDQDNSKMLNQLLNHLEEKYNNSYSIFNKIKSKNNATD